MDTDQKDELQAMVVSLLTQSLKDRPSGFELREFEREFPVRLEEPANWYTNYKCKNALDALKQLDGGAVRVQISRNGQTFISLNTRSDKVDQHLVSLVVGQKASTKKRARGFGGGRSAAQRARDSFAMNLFDRHSNSRPTANNRPKPRLNVANSYNKSWNHFNEKPSSQANVPRPTIYKEAPSRAAPGDPRAQRASVQTGSAQVRSSPTVSQPSYTSGPPPTKHQPQVTNQAKWQSTWDNIKSSTKPATTKLSESHQTSSPAAHHNRTHKPHTASPIDEKMERDRCSVKQRLKYLLTSKHSEINMLFLGSLYQAEFGDRLDPVPLGYKSLTQLYDSFKDMITISYNSTMPMVVLKADSGGVASAGCNDRQGANGLNNGSHHTVRNEDKENLVQTARQRYNAIDPFNVTKMLQSLEPLKRVREPQLGTNKVEDAIKYRTMRVIFRDPNMTLKLVDWERKYQQEWNCTNIKVHIHDYGYKTLLEFFKGLATELPIKIRLRDSDWIATSNTEDLSRWLKQRVASGHFKAVTVIDAKYEHIAYPGDKYNYLDFKSLQKQEYYDAIKMAVTSAHKLWLQQGSSQQERIEDSVSFETSSSCYDDFKRKGFFSIPDDGFLKIGFPCAAFDNSEQRWCRAIIVKVGDKIDGKISISAFLVDYAITKNFAASNLLCLLHRDLNTPVGRLQSTIN